MNLQALNARNNRFWEEHAVAAEGAIRDPLVLKMTLAYIDDELRRVAVHAQKTFESALESSVKTLGIVQQGLTEALRKELTQEIRKETAKHAACAPRADTLQKLIEEEVRKYPQMTCAELLKILADQKGSGVVEDVEEKEVWFAAANGKLIDAPISGLKDRLSRAKRN